MSDTPDILQPEKSADAFSVVLRNAGFSATELTLRDGLAQVLLFYKNVKFDALPTTADGDMLLFQYGTYNWQGTGATFQADFTRQFIHHSTTQDNEMSQLSLTFHYPVVATTGIFGAANEWLKRGDAGLTAWKQFVQGTEVYQQLELAKPIRVDLAWSMV